MSGRTTSAQSAVVVDGETREGSLNGKVAFVTGAARGQGRAHAVRLASDGADVIAVDLCDQIASVPYPMAARDDGWRDVIDVNLTGVYHTVDVAIPIMIEQGTGGAVVLTSSVAGLVAVGGANGGAIGYAAAKHGVVGLMRVYANVLARHNIRVNSIHPSAVYTPMIDNEYIRRWESELPTDVSNALPVQMVAPEDVANAVVWLVSDAARYVTGVTLPVDAGFVVKR